MHCNQTAHDEVGVFRGVAFQLVICFHGQTIRPGSQNHYIGHRVCCFGFQTSEDLAGSALKLLYLDTSLCRKALGQLIGQTSRRRHIDRHFAGAGCGSGSAIACHAGRSCAGSNRAACGAAAGGQGGSGSQSTRHSKKITTADFIITHKDSPFSFPMMYHQAAPCGRKLIQTATMALRGR